MFEDFSIRTVYIGCSVIGGAVLSLQMILLFFGGDADFDAEGEYDGGGDGLSLLSIRSVAGFLTFFGLTGLWGSIAGWGAGKTLGIAFGSGAAMMLIVAWLMSLHSKLYSEGNVRPESALGKPARVYLRIPGERSGQGKITVATQGRTHEYNAVTSGPELATGSEVRVLNQVTENTFEVEAL